MTETELVSLTIGEKDYPSLYRAASKLSARKQRFFYIGLFFQLLLMALIVLSSALLSTYTFFKTIQLVLVIILFALSIFLYFTKSVKHWYSARAIAESVKTLTWRYIMRAAPFDEEDEKSKKLYCERLVEIVKQNKDLSSAMAPSLDSEQITQKMKEVRTSDTDKRAEVYLEGRVRNQHDWYAKKANVKGLQNMIFTGLFLAIVVLVLAYAILQLQVFDAAYWPIDLAVTIAIGVLTWIQAKKFSELRASYSQASYEIALVNSCHPDTFTEEDLAEFVKEAENAFSREHTQWVARRDY